MQHPSVNKWVVALTVVFGTFIAVMDISVVNVALPHMMGYFGQSLSAITWVATSYSIAEIILATMAGWLSTLLGRKRLYLLSFILFTVGSVLAGTSRTFTQMIVYRVIQGVGGGALIPVSQAIVRESFPQEEQGMAMAVYSMGVVLAPAIGPILGGWLTDRYGWPWIFYINVPVSVVGIFMVGAFVHDPPYLKRGVNKVDWVGIALLTICLTGMQIVLERGEEYDWFESRFIIVGTVITAVAAISLVAWELWIDEPIINFRILKNIPLTLGSTMGLVFGVALYASTFILPQFTQDLLGYTAYDSGMVLLPRAVSLFILMPVAGWLYRYLDPRLLVFWGVALMWWSFHDLANLSLNDNFWTITPMLLIMGAGMPFMFVTLSTVSLSTVDRSDMTEASSIFTLTRRIGGNIGYALVATLIAHSLQEHRTYMVGRLSAFNPSFMAMRQQLAHGLTASGLSGNAAGRTAMAALDAMVNRQATMLAYNDASWWLGLLVLATFPMILLLPGRTKSGIPIAVELVE